MTEGNVEYVPAYIPSAGAVPHGTDVATHARASDGAAVQDVYISSDDETTGAVAVIDYHHHEVHEGDYFKYINAQDLTNAQTISFVVVTPNTAKWAHFGFTLESELEFDLQMFEGATPDANGTAASAPAIINANRNSSTTPTLAIYGGPTLGAGSKGTLIARWHGGAGKKSGAESGTAQEIILKQNTKYWFDVTNSVTTANFVSWYVGWYEHTNR